MPDTEEARQALYKIRTADLISIYINWVDRFIPPRPRTPMVWGGFWTRNSPRQYANEIDQIIEIARHGRDLTPYLSSRVHTHGFVARNSDKTGIDWRDKDLALNAYNVHHLHLTPVGSTGKRKGDSDKLLYVGVSRNELLLLMVGDHKSFNDGTLTDAVLEYRAQSGNLTMQGVAGLSDDREPQECQKLARHGISSASMVNGVAVMGAMISLAGTSIDHTRYSDECCEVIESIEEVIDDRSRLLDILNLDDGDLPPKPVWEWRFAYADLHLVDTQSKSILRVCRWRR
jgi:hypothetical protein